MTQRMQTRPRVDTSAVVAREAVEQLGRTGLEPHDFFQEVSSRVRRVVPHDASCWMTLDPDSLLPSGTLQTGKPPELVRTLWRNELLEPDVHKFADLSRRREPLAASSELDEARAAASPRIASIHRAAGIGDELRVMLRANGSTWGAVTLYRDLAEPDFDEGERAFMAGVSGEIADGLRRSLARRPEPGAEAIVPGVATVRADGCIVSTTPEADRLMTRIAGDATATLSAVAIRAARKDGARTRVRLPDGHWLQLHGAPMRGPEGAPAEVAVTLLPAARADVASVLLRLLGLSAREREVAQLLLTGLPTEDVAGRLHISRHTLHDHTKSVFTKVGARSRAELMTLAGDPTM